MKANFLETLVDSESECYYNSPKHIRVALISGIIMYSVFGFLDKYMLPESYHYAWTIRFCIIAPSAVLFYFFTFSQKFIEYGRFWLTLLVILAQLGIITMMYLAKPGEGAFLSYYAGLILVILWGVLVFRLSIPEVIISSITNLIFYNTLTLGIQKIQYSQEGFSFLLNNNFFLLSTSSLSVLGSYQISRYKRKLQLHNQLLTNERKELIKAKKRAEDSDLLKSAFLANMSHEIRTPMNAILGFGELLKDTTLPEKKREAYINIIQAKGNQLLRLINDIIDLSKIETNNIVISPAPLHLNQLFDELALAYERVLQMEKKKGSMKLIFHEALGNSNDYIMADGIRLKQVLSNLLDNALKFTNTGEILIGYEMMPPDKLKFFVKDTGIGIPEDMQSTIFERFRQVDSLQIHSNAQIYKGTGLGLSIVKSLVELAGGEVWVESVMEKGSSFYFTYPFQPAYNDPNLKPSGTFGTKKVNWKGKTILIAEDDDDNFLYLKELLAVTSATLLRALNGKEALNIALGPEKIDIILMDIKMPYLNGYEATQQIKQIKSGIPIIAQTAYAMEEDRKKAMGANCDEYISKPIEPNELILLMEKYLK
jgi:signal transduction histidine kinase/CheY-like chemotaxis protein